MDFKDYYKVMGLPVKATAAEIKQAYRKLAKKFHPDVSKEQDAGARFQEIGEAYEVLSNTEKRVEYDQLKTLHTAGGGRRSASPGAHMSDDEARSQFNDIFESAFGTDSNSRRGYQSTRDNNRDPFFSYKGKDLHHRLVVLLEEAAKGGQRTLKLEVPTADARGDIYSKSKTLNVKIPAGVLPLQLIRLAGQGGTGFGGETNGDLFLEIEFAPHPLFAVAGRDILLDLPVAPWEAALGTKVEVPTLTGTINLTIPEGSVSGKKLRLKGRGIGLSPTGDQIITLQVTLPAKHSTKAKELYQQLAEVETSFKPRSAMQNQL